MLITAQYQAKCAVCRRTVHTAEHNLPKWSRDPTNEILCFACRERFRDWTYRERQKGIPPKIALVAWLTWIMKTKPRWFLFDHASTRQYVHGPQIERAERRAQRRRAKHDERERCRYNRRLKARINRYMDGLAARFGLERGEAHILKTIVSSHIEYGLLGLDTSDRDACGYSKLDQRMLRWELNRLRELGLLQRRAEVDEVYNSWGIPRLKVHEVWAPTWIVRPQRRSTW